MRTRKITPWLYITPAVFLLTFFLIYPSIYTTYISLFNYNSEKFVGIKNYLYCFTNEIMLPLDPCACFVPEDPERFFTRGHDRCSTAWGW